MNTSLSPDERAALLLAQMTLEEKVDMLHEENRLEVDAQLNERTLREIYTLPFAAAVQDGHVGAVMGAFNKINGIYCCEHPHLLSRMLSSGQGYRPCRLDRCHAQAMALECRAIVVDHTSLTAIRVGIRHDHSRRKRYDDSPGNDSPGIDAGRWRQWGV